MDDFFLPLLFWLAGVDDYLTLHAQVIVDVIVFFIRAMLWTFAISYFVFSCIKFYRDMRSPGKL